MAHAPNSFCIGAGFGQEVKRPVRLSATLCCILCANLGYRHSIVTLPEKHCLHDWPPFQTETSVWEDLR